MEKDEGDLPLKKRLQRDLLLIAEVFLIGFIVLVFCLAAFQSILFLVYNGDGLFRDFAETDSGFFLFSSIVTMAVSGLGLILLLLLKLRSISTIYAHNKKLQEQFYQAQKVEALGRLAGGIAHDFNNILSSIMGYAGFLMDDLKPDTEQHHFARQIEQGSRQARALVEQILAFSRRQGLSRSAVDLAQMMNETVEMLKSTIAPTIDIEVEIDQGRHVTEGSASQIGQVLMNLSVNACDSMEDDGGILSFTIQGITAEDVPYKKMIVKALPPDRKIPPIAFYDAGAQTTVTVGNLVAGHDYLCVAVTDTGSGMGSATMAHIFEPFYTTKEIGKGTGLGLASVHGIVAEHGAAMVVQSEPQRGTSFFLYFPRALEKETAAAGAQKPAATARSFEDLRVVLVDDQKELRDMMEKMLTRLGCRVDVYASGYEAIDGVREHPGRHDLVISDFSMPQMNGVELAQELGADFPKLPVILMTGYGPETLEAEIEKLPNIRCLLRKPLENDVLRARMIDVLGVG